jgi:hypothetical protein
MKKNFTAFDFFATLFVLGLAITGITSFIYVMVVEILKYF